MKNLLHGSRNLNLDILFPKTMIGIPRIQRLCCITSDQQNTRHKVHLLIKFAPIIIHASAYAYFGFQPISNSTNQSASSLNVRRLDAAHAPGIQEIQRLPRALLRDSANSIRDQSDFKTPAEQGEH